MSSGLTSPPPAVASEASRRSSLIVTDMLPTQIETHLILLVAPPLALWGLWTTLNGFIASIQGPIVRAIVDGMLLTSIYATLLWTSRRYEINAALEKRQELPSVVSGVNSAKVVDDEGL